MNAADRTRKSRPPADPGPSPDPEPRPSAALRRSTGRDRGEWFAMLDTWGAAGRAYREIAVWLTGEHGVSPWWAQKLIVEYEQARGLRDAGVRPDGTFAGGASKTIAAPVERLFDAFVDPTLRERWLPGAVMQERTSQAGRSARFDWDDGASRVNVTFNALDDAKGQVAVEHDHLPDGLAAAQRKAYWRERLGALKTLLEG
ncbi:MAG TPA: hypothetical protein VK736_00235 [Candidatus Binatia bacterium]|nr:hypothetical protein [Candidatus Binatia bacterium]